MTTIKLLSTGLIAIAMLTTTAVARENFAAGRTRVIIRGAPCYMGYMGNSAPARLLDCLARHSNMVRSVGPGRARQHLRRGRQCEDMLSGAAKVITRMYAEVGSALSAEMRQAASPIPHAARRNVSHACAPASQMAP